MIERKEQTPPNEGPTEIKRFSDRTRERLRKSGYVIYLLGTSVSEMRVEGRSFSVGWNENEPDFERGRSFGGEVAVNPRYLFLSDSEKQDQQGNIQAVSFLSKRVVASFPGARVIMGSAVDYMALFFAHLDATGETLFETNTTVKEGRRIIVTRTTSTLPPETEFQTNNNANGRYTRDLNVAVISSRCHIQIGSAFRHNPNIYTGVAPLIIPT